MTGDEYIQRSNSAHHRLKQIRDQLDQHAKKAHPAVTSNVVKPLHDAQQRIIGEIQEIERDFWGAPPVPTSPPPPPPPSSTP